MTEKTIKTPTQIRELQARHPEMRERDFARIHGISEGELVAAEVGRSAVRLQVDLDLLLNGLRACGEVMALTRNESAVHEKIGPYEKVVIGPRFDGAGRADRSAYLPVALGFWLCGRKGG
ncbi:hypothetical protein N8D56_08110 [Devosia sp. A8/3-2]|nr:hypothetical protein N8D56_08110 [Devosia sp. A8/3-2]